jgi:hypothetical protein
MPGDIGRGWEIQADRRFGSKNCAKPSRHAATRPLRGARIGFTRRRKYHRCRAGPQDEGTKIIMLFSGSPFALFVRHGGHLGGAVKIDF